MHKKKFIKLNREKNSFRGISDEHLNYKYLTNMLKTKRKMMPKMTTRKKMEEQYRSLVRIMQTLDQKEL